MKTIRRLFAPIVVVALSSLVLGAAAQPRPPYGTAINLETARKISAAAEAEARKNGWNVAIAIVDNHGLLVFYEMLDDTQTASANVALEKARTAAIYRRTTKELEDASPAAATPSSACPARRRSRAACRSSSAAR